MVSLFKGLPWPASLRQNLRLQAAGGQYQALDTEPDQTERAREPHPGLLLIQRYNVVHYLKERTLVSSINIIAGLAIFYFGYDQGYMGIVNDVEDYYDKTMHFGHSDETTGQAVITNAFLQGLIV